MRWTKGGIESVTLLSRGILDLEMCQSARPALRISLDLGTAGFRKTSRVGPRGGSLPGQWARV